MWRPGADPDIFKGGDYAPPPHANTKGAKPGAGCLGNEHQKKSEKKENQSVK